MSEEYMDDDFDSETDDLEVDGEEMVDDESESIFNETSEIDFEALGIVAEAPTEAKPGSERKVLTLAARYAAGLPLWDSSDRYDHAPGQTNLSGLKFDA